MELRTAIEILEYHQEWRIGKRDDMIHEPKTITEALDRVLREVKKKLTWMDETITCPFCESINTVVICAESKCACDDCLNEFEV